MDPEYPLPPLQPQNATPNGSGGEEDAQRRIEREARNVLRGFPVAAGLTGVADVISHLPPLAPTPPSFFPAPDATSLQSISTGMLPAEPLFDDYSREISIMLGGGGQSVEEERWRQNELARLSYAPELRQQMASLQQGGSIPPLPPPFPFVSIGHNPSPSTSSSLSHRFLNQVGFPLAPTPTSFANPSPSPNLISPDDNYAFLDSYISEHLKRLIPRNEPTPAYSNGSSPIKSEHLPPLPPPQPPTPSSHHRVQHSSSHQVPESSPDPLMMGLPASSPFHRSLPPLPRFVPQNGVHHRTATNGSSTASPFSLPSGSPHRLDHQFSPHPSQLGGPFQENAGVESAVKRIKLGSGAGDTPVFASGGSGRGKVIGGETKNSVERLSDLLSDIFSADDSHILDTSSSALAHSAPNPILRSPSRTANANSVSHFRTTAVSPSDSAPLLSTSTLSKLYKYLQSVSKKNKGEELLEEVEDAGLSRLLKLLARSWDGISEQTYWENEAVKARDEDEAIAPTGKGKGKGKAKSASPDKKRGKKKKSTAVDSDDDEGEGEMIGQGTENDYDTTRRRSSRSMSRSRSPAVQQQEEEEEEEEEATQDGSSEFWTTDSINSTHRSLRNLSDALLAIRTALAILTLGGVSLPKHLFSSDYLESLLAVLRHTLDSFLNPLLESPTTCALSDLFSPAFSETRDKVQELCDNLCSTTDSFSSLVEQEDMGDDLINSAVFFALDPFFHEAAQPLPVAGKRKTATTNSTQSKTGTMQHALKNMRMSSLTLVRHIYARYAEQRSSIVEEVLSNLGRGDGTAAKKGRGEIRLRNNASIQTVSALLLHLVQTCSADLDLQVRKVLAGNIKESKSEDADGDVKMDTDSKAPDEKENETQQFSIIRHRLVDPAHDSAFKSARTIIDVLLGRSSKVGKAAAGTADAEYRKVLDHLIADLLSTLHLPEWPGSELFLTVLSRYLMTALSDTKTSAEANSLRGIALDHLGVIIARIRHDCDAAEKDQLKSLPEIVLQGDVHALEKLFSAQSSLISHLTRLEESSSSSQGALDLTRVLIARELFQASDSFASPASDIDSAQTEQLNALKDRIETFSRSIWEAKETQDVFGPTPEDAQPRIDSISLALSRSQPLATMYQPLITRVIEASESSQVALRTKALRAIGLVVAQDPNLFHQENVRQSIENRMHDLSPAVRDTTIELVGKHIVNKPDLATQYLPQLIGRLSDSGLSVRRRVVKLLRVLYGILDDEKHRTEICRNLIGRVLDEDDGVRELAVDTLEDLWFAPTDKTSISQSSTSLSNVILNVVGVHQGRVPPIEEALRLIMAKHVEKGTEAPLDRLREVMETLIDSLVVDNSSVDVVACVKTISILSAVDPSLLTTAKATLLVPFLKGATTAEEKAISDYLLIVFRSAALATPKTASKFGKDLQAALIPMLNRPPAQIQTVQAVISCFAAVIWNQTQDFAMMVKIFIASMNRLLAERSKLVNPARRSEVKLPQISVLCYLVSLLCEHGNFDKMRAENQAIQTALDKISPNSIADFVFNVLIELHNLELPAEFKSTVLTSLSFIWRGYPTLMIEPASTSIIDTVFASSDRGLQLQILRIVQNFLASQERSAPPAPTAKAKRKKSETGVQMDELVGNVEGFADSGVASSIAQRYLEPILRVAVSTHPQLQRVGIDVISMIARSGFSHPLLLAPTIVALTASPDSQVASKANSTFTILHQKHASILITRFLESAKASHAYMKGISAPSPPRGYRGDPPDSCFGRWFSLIHKEKRQVQLDYLKQLCRAFEVESGSTCSENDVSFARFVAEAISTLDFKRTEEPMLVISRLNTVLAVSGLQVLHSLEAESGGGGLLDLDDAEMKEAEPAQNQANSTATNAPSLDLVHRSIVAGLALLLRDHLKQLYSINDAKIAKYAVGKKSAAGDKACTRRNGASLALGEDNYPRMPFAFTPLETEQDLIDQRSKFVSLVHEDGTINTLEEIGDEDDDA
ncbi:hypothetical protein JCM5350_007201 [Sporobolomyces pararoseus]